VQWVSDSATFRNLYTPELMHQIKNTCFVVLQHLLPQHALSRIMHSLTRNETVWWKNLIIRQVVKRFKVNLAEAENPDIESYASFNKFFTRALGPGARPLAQDVDIITSPADGAISQIGVVQGAAILQAKGKIFTTEKLLGGSPGPSDLFNHGHFVTIYLSPRDYHRLHMPCDGVLKKMIHIPGQLFSVNSVTTESVDNLFARNERVVAIFETPLGAMALVLVGAIFVSSIETVWHGVVTPPRSQSIRTWDYNDNPITLKRGQEMGRFNMGSTIIVLFEKKQVQWLTSLSAGSTILMGEKLGSEI